jgi:hypothetical protein
MKRETNKGKQREGGRRRVLVVVPEITLAVAPVLVLVLVIVFVTVLAPATPTSTSTYSSYWINVEVCLRSDLTLDG